MSHPPNVNHNSHFTLATTVKHLALGDRHGFGVRDLQRPGPAADVAVVGLVGDEGDTHEEGEPRGESDHETSEGGGL